MSVPERRGVGYSSVPQHLNDDHDRSEKSEPTEKKKKNIKSRIIEAAQPILHNFYLIIIIQTHYRFTTAHGSPAKMRSNTYGHKNGSMNECPRDSRVAQVTTTPCGEQRGKPVARPCQGDPVQTTCAYWLAGLVWWEASAVTSHYPTDKEVALSDLAFRYDVA
ncbi:jg4809 [Pararge aegeria aegeria]|uniref:Jg4809 protein n=1 Tax=Pararge aegeria aegeria TaxID=348720 RepID=A0A8S4SJ18_9NEOP|nr:jg4809 [Pararge aegeria aegeria]